tara:strand:- start:5205 stop:6215 length:1011 start_codon:yes stop_codon:yes gene_type:complete
MKTYIIAEVGPNHNGDLNIAIKFINELAKIKCNAVKFQHGIPKNIYSNQSIFPDYQSNLKKKYKSPIVAAKKRLLKNEDHIRLNKECIKNKIDYLCSAFDLESIVFLNENTNMSYFKIPSGEILSLDILNYIRNFDKKIILSTGMATKEEIDFSISYLNKNFTKDITLLHCISSYPTKNKDINLIQIKEIQERYNLKVGLSDHTVTTFIPAHSIYLGACIIEKHVTFDNQDFGPDHKTSLEINEFKKMIKLIREAEIIYGKHKRKFNKSERNVKETSRKSITAKTNIRKNEIITMSKITFKRPGNGISPLEIDKIIHKKSKKNILKNNLLKWEDIN